MNRTNLDPSTQRLQPLARFPFWIIESSRVVHFMEAVLACLAIIFWHFYWVIFDPEVYPMDFSWLRGKARLGRDKNRDEGLRDK